MSRYFNMFKRTENKDIFLYAEGLQFPDGKVAIYYHIPKKTHNEILDDLPKCDENTRIFFNGYRPIYAPSSWD